MPRIDVNFGDVPDTIKTISPGKYRLEIAEVPAVEPAASGNGQNLIINFRISDEGEFKGRQIRDYIFLNEIGLTKVKSLLISAGLESSVNGLDTEELLGKIVTGLLVASTYKDKATDETVQTTKVGRYLKA